MALRNLPSPRSSKKQPTLSHNLEPRGCKVDNPTKLLPYNPECRKSHFLPPCTLKTVYPEKPFLGLAKPRPPTFDYESHFQTPQYILLDTCLLSQRSKALRSNVRFCCFKANQVYFIFFCCLNSYNTRNTMEIDTVQIL